MTASNSFSASGRFLSPSAGAPKKLSRTRANSKRQIMKLFSPATLKPCTCAYWRAAFSQTPTTCPGRNVVVIDDVLANKAFHGQSAVGKRILIRLRTPEAEWVEIVGVVAHQHAVSLDRTGA